ncbi:hypothetical protein N2152v2_005712 [Parachlorella kessleri]
MSPTAASFRALPLDPARGGGDLGAGWIAGAACCGAAVMVGFALWRRQSGGDSTGHRRGHRGGTVGDQGQCGFNASTRPKDYQQVWMGPRSCPDEDLSSLRAELSTTLQSLVVTQGALLELHMKRSSDRNESSRELAELKADLSKAARELRAAQESLQAKANTASMGTDASTGVDTPRLEARTGLLLHLLGGCTGDVLSAGSVVPTSLSGSGLLAPAPANERAESARSMFAHSAGPQWEDVECRLLWRIAHPNVVTFYGACVSEGQGYLLMELMATDLGAALHSRPERREDRSYAWAKKGARVALQIAAGLSYLHQHRIVHLDLKPKNVLLARDGTAKLADVGFSRVMKSDVLSNLGDRFGTFDYCAPEVLLGQAASEKADIYSFGVLLWEICAGEAPSRGKMRPLRAPQECPEQVRDLQLECVRLSPWDRPSAAQIVRAFHSLRRANALSAPAPLPAAAGSGETSSAGVATSTSPLVSTAAYGGMEQPAPGGPAAAVALTPFANPFANNEHDQQAQQEPSVAEDMPAVAQQFVPCSMLPGPSMTLESPFKSVGLPSRRASMDDSAEQVAGKMASLKKEPGH